MNVDTLSQIEIRFHENVSKKKSLKAKIWRNNIKKASLS